MQDASVAAYANVLATRQQAYHQHTHPKRGPSIAHAVQTV